MLPIPANISLNLFPRGRFDGSENLEENECSGELILWLLQFLFKYGTDYIIHLVCLVPLGRSRHFCSVRN